MLTISNANPFQFWLTGEESFNQKEVCSIYPVCFCQQIDPSDTIRLDIIDTLDTPYSLGIILDDGILFSTYEFSNGNNHHQYVFIDDSFESILNRKFMFKIFDQGSAISISAPSSWTDSIGSWDSKDATTFAKNILGIGSGIVCQSYQSCAVPAGRSIKITYNLHIDSFSGVNASFIIAFSLRNSSGVDVGSSIFDSGNGTYSSNRDGSITQTITTSSDATRLYITIDRLNSAHGFIILTVDSGKVIFISDSSIYASSDCIDVVEDDCTQLIKYSNSTSFAGLDFTLSSPTTDFQLRIPAIFFDENYPQEQEDLELSDDTIVTLWSKIEAKKTLDIGYMPFYMHLKLQMILMMDDVTIDGVAYRLRDPYQITPSSSKRSALRRASVVLSQKDFIDRNLL